MLHDESWHAERRTAICGSDSPVLLGVIPPHWDTPMDIYLYKRGLVTPEASTPDQLRGHVLEGIVAEMYAAKTGRILEAVPGMVRHPQHDWMGAHPDRVWTDPAAGKRGVLEIKCPRLRRYAACKRQGLPAYYSVQLQHYMAVLGLDVGSFAVFSAESWEMLEFDVRRDDDLIAEIIVRGKRFWDMLQEGRSPDEAPSLPEVAVAPTGGAVRKIDDPLWAAAVEDYAAAKRAGDEAGGLIEAAKEEMVRIMGDAEVAEGGGARVHYTEQAGRVTLDEKTLAAEHPEVDLGRYRKRGKPYKVFRLYETKE